MDNRITHDSSGIRRRRSLQLLTTGAVLSIAGCTGETGNENTQQLSLEEFFTEHSGTRGQEKFFSAYNTVMNTSAGQLTVQDLEEARDGFSQASEDYNRLRTSAENQFNLHDSGTELKKIFETLSSYYRLLGEASDLGRQGLDSLLDNEDIIEAFSRSSSSFESMEEKYNEALDKRKQITLYRDTKGTTPKEIVGDWIRNNETSIQSANSDFSQGTSDFNQRKYTSAKDNFINAGEEFANLLEKINSEFATTYPRKSDLYQLFGDVSYYFNQMRDVSESVANSARLRADSDFESAVEYEQNVQEEYSEGVDAWESARENIETLGGQFNIPSIPQFEEETEPIESQEKAEQVVLDWLEENEGRISTRSVYRGEGDDEYEQERYEEASDWYSTIAEDYDKLEQDTANQADNYENDYIVEMFTLYSDYFDLLGKSTKKMQEAASARAAGLSGEADTLEAEAEQHMTEAESLKNEIDNKLPDNQN